MISGDSIKCKLIDKLTKDIDSEKIPLYKMVYWDKKFKSIPKEWQPRTFKVNHISAEEMKKISRNDGIIKLLSTGLFNGYVDSYDEDYVNELEVLTLPTGGSANIKYYNGKFIDSGNLLAQTIDKNKYNLKYIYYCLFGKKKYINDYCYRGSSIKHPEMSKILNIELCISTIEKQQDVVNKLDIMFELIDKKEHNDQEKRKLKEILKVKILDNAIHGRLVEKYDNLSAKDFVDELIKAKDYYIQNNKLSKSKDSNSKNELFEIPNHWCWSTIGDICFVTKLAGFEYTKYIANNLSNNGDVPVVRAQNIKPNCFVDNCQEYISMNLSEKLYRCALDSKCVLMTFIGAGIGEVCIFDKEKRYHLAPNVAKIVPAIDINKYIMYYLMSKEGKKNIFDYKKSTAQASLSMETIRNVAIPIPPKEELNKIVEKIESLFELIEQL